MAKRWLVLYTDDDNENRVRIVCDPTGQEPMNFINDPVEAGLDADHDVILVLELPEGETAGGVDEAIPEFVIDGDSGLTYHDCES